MIRTDVVQRDMVIRTVRIIPAMRAGTRKRLGMVSVSVVVVQDGVAELPKLADGGVGRAVIKYGQCLLYISTMVVQYNICEWSDGVYNNIAHRWAK